MTQSDNRGWPDGLVETVWLADHLDDPSVKIIEATFTLPGVSPTGYERYVQAHIPNAVFYDIEKIADPHNPLPHMLPSEADFAVAMGRLGIENNHYIVVYDAFGLSSAPRAWWMLRAYGHPSVAILNGGLPRWQAEGRPVTTEMPAFNATQFFAKLDPARVRNKAQMLANLTSGQAQVVDARSAARFAGTVKETRPGLRSGHIPGSLSLPSDQLIDADRRTVLPRGTLTALYRRAGIVPAKPTITSCGSGVAACALAFGMYLLGWPEPAIYDGSWSEWGRPGETPVET